jgi:hypothetical protein
MPEFTCRLSGRARPVPRVWEHTVGSGHAPLALRADWPAQLRRCPYVVDGLRRAGFRCGWLEGA